MEAVERSTLRVPAARSLRFDPAGAAAWLLPALLIVYLALANGGYDVVERSEVGIAVWWIVLVGTVVGAFPAAGGTRAGRAMLGLLAAFAGWTALSLGWTDSDERTAIELGRVAAYVGVFALALAVQGQGRWRHLLNGATAGLALVCGLAVLSRLEPTWFPDNASGQFLPGIEIESRLTYPLNYSSGVGALAAMTLPLLLYAAWGARTLVMQALSAAAIPVVALTLWLTTSSLSVPAAAIAVGAFLILAPDRLPKLGTLAIAGAGSAILIAASEQREAFGRGLPTPEALHQGGELEVVLLVVCAGVALLQTGLGLAVRYGHRPEWLHIPPVQARRATALACLAVLLGLVVAAATGELGERWDTFRGGGAGNPADESRSSQLFEFSSSGRYQYWESAVDANKTEPLAGIGPGTFEYWYAKEGSGPGFARDAHSLYIETLAELGIVGLLLIGGFSLAVLGYGTARALRAPPDLRLAIAAAVAGCAGFTATAMVDWVWELAMLPCAFLVLAAVAIAGGREAPERDEPAGPGWLRYRDRIAMAGLAIAAIIAISVPLAVASEVADSQAAVANGDLQRALDDARDAEAIQPYAASAHVQEALILEQLGDYQGAAAAARTAVAKEGANWRNWVVLSRLEAEAGNAAASVDAYRHARSLNPQSPLFQ